MDRKRNKMQNMLSLEASFGLTMLVSAARTTFLYVPAPFFVQRVLRSLRRLICIVDLGVWNAGNISTNVERSMRSGITSEVSCLRDPVGARLVHCLWYTLVLSHKRVKVLETSSSLCATYPFSASLTASHARGDQLSRGFFSQT